MNPIRQAFSLCAVAALLAACGGASNDGSTGATLTKSGGATQHAAASKHAPAEYAPLVQYLYLSYLGRPADYVGLEFWERVFSDNGMPVVIGETISAYQSNGVAKRLVDQFVYSAESIGLYTGVNAAYVNAVYLNIFNRNSEAGGRAFWRSLLDQSVLSRGLAVLTILNAAQGDDATVVAKKNEAAIYFTDGLAKGPSYMAAYAGDSASEGARQLLGRITATTDMAAFKLEIDAFLDSLVNGGPGSGIQVSRYSGFNYLQDMDAGPSYSAKYTRPPAGLPQGAGSVTYGEVPVTVNWTRSVSTGAFTYDAPVSGSQDLQFDGIGSGPLARLSNITVLCTSVAGSSKSTDILVANNAQAVVDALELANQTLGVYREDCGVSSGAGNAESFAFDQAGNVVIKLQGGVSTYSASVVNQALDGKMLFDITTKKYWTFKAYKFIKQDGSYAYAIVQHQGDSATGLKSGTLGLWTQQ